MGPNLDHAKAESLEAFDEIKKLLVKNYHLLFDTHVMMANPGIKRTSDWGVTVEKENQLRNLITEIFIEEACNGF